MLYVLAAEVVVLAAICLHLEGRIRRLTRGRSGANLEETINSIDRMLNRLFEYGEKVDRALEDHDRRLKRSIQAVRTIRFNPFDGKGQGGNQSFATAILDEEGNGIVISTLYSREQVRVFGKPIKNFNSEHELSAEERQAIKEARL